MLAFGPYEALDPDGFVLDQQVDVDLFADLRWELYKVAGVRHIVSRRGGYLVNCELYGRWNLWTTGQDNERRLATVSEGGVYVRRIPMGM